MAAYWSTLEADLPGGGTRREMELLKDLPSYDGENFSKFCRGSWKDHQVLSKPYIRLKNGSEDHAIEILTDQTSIMLRDLEREAKNRRLTLKRSSGREDTSRKVPRLDQDSDSD